MESGSLMKDKIVEKYSDFTTQERKIAKYVVDHYALIISMSTSDLSQKAGVSEATVVRFAKTLGYKGFLQFKNQLKEEYSAGRSPYKVLQGMGGYGDNNIIHPYLQSIQNDIGELQQNLDFKLLETIADELLSAETVYLVGIGSDKVVANYLNNYFPISGIQSITITEEGLAMKEKVLLAKPSDVVFMSSFPTVQKDEYWISDYMQDIGVPLIALTDSDITAKAFHSKYHINISRSMDTFFNSCALSMAICDILLLKLHERAPHRVETTLKKYHQILNPNEE